MHIIFGVSYSDVTSPLAANTLFINTCVIYYTPLWYMFPLTDYTKFRDVNTGIYNNLIAFQMHKCF